MSLLIKALDKAEKDQAKYGKAEQKEVSQPDTDWSLAPISKDEKAAGSALLSNSADVEVVSVLNSSEVDEDSLAFRLEPSLRSAERANARTANSSNSSQAYQPAASFNKAQQVQQDKTISSQRERAAQIFAAKRVDNASDKKMIAMGVAGLVALLLTGTGLYSYFFNNILFGFLPKKTSPAMAQVVMQLPTMAPTVASTPEKQMVKPFKKVMQADGDLGVDNAVATKSDARTSTAKTSKRLISSPSTSVSTTVSVTKNKSETGVSPTLMNAYQAYTVGDDVKAQQLYKQVLQTESRNSDAMLGLAAIAQRQNRTEDAAGWYRKVLELDPKNAIAQASLINVQVQDTGQDDGTARESRLKNLIAQQPENANLQGALGSLYADQNQWASAQQAYFEAHRLAPSNADFTFNLAASLDQMRKPKLALPYYKRALELLPKAGGSGIDEVAVRARIKAIE